MYYIYKIVNSKSPKIYIGVTNNFQKRIREHSYGNGNGLLARAVRKYGWDSFSYEILEKTNNREKEIYYINELNCKHPNGYNLTEGGEGCVGYEVSLQTREKMRKAKLGKKLSESQKDKIGQYHKGKKLPYETKEKISKKLIGNKNFEGHTFTEETKKKLSIGRSKIWDIRKPDGSLITVYNMRNFCLENNLSPSAISLVLSGKITHHKKWTKP